MTKARLEEFSVSLKWGMMGRCGACRCACACSCQDRSRIRGCAVAKNSVCQCCDRFCLICPENVLSEREDGQQACFIFYGTF